MQAASEKIARGSKNGERRKCTVFAVDSGINLLISNTDTTHFICVSSFLLCALWTVHVHALHCYRLECLLNGLILILLVAKCTLWTCCKRIHIIWTAGKYLYQPSGNKLGNLSECDVRAHALQKPADTTWPHSFFYEISTEPSRYNHDLGDESKNFPNQAMSSRAEIPYPYVYTCFWVF